MTRNPIFAALGAQSSPLLSMARAERHTEEQTKCIGCSEQMEIAREKRENRAKPQPWVVQKLTVGIVIGVLTLAS
jgi:hypothetical protein